MPESENWQFFIRVMPLYISDVNIGFARQPDGVGDVAWDGEAAHRLERERAVRYAERQRPYPMIGNA